VTARRLLLALLLAVGLAASACGGGEPTAEEYGAAVVANRDRVDFALGRIPRAQSLDELLERMDEAAAAIDRAAGELEDAGAPPEYQPEAGNLVEGLRQLAVDVQATADQARIPGFETLLTDPMLRGLSFESWTRVDKALAGLAGKGIEVSVLQRQGG
jgi:hypothetical protein